MGELLKYNRDTIFANYANILILRTISRQMYGGSIGGVSVIWILGANRMKKPKVVKPFYFKGLTNQQVIDQLNEKYPVNVKYNEDLIDRICARYPFINKIQVSIIVKSVFQSFRDLLLLGKVLNFNNLFFNVKLHFFDYRKNGHILPSLKVKISTPPPLRKHDK